jgi:hypothetical protein
LIAILSLSEAMNLETWEEGDTTHQSAPDHRIFRYPRESILLTPPL